MTDRCMKFPFLGASLTNTIAFDGQSLIRVDLNHRLAMCVFSILNKEKEYRPSF
jgi:hypothetical protein